MPEYLRIAAHLKFQQLENCMMQLLYWGEPPDSPRFQTWVR